MQPYPPVTWADLPKLQQCNTGEFSTKAASSCSSCSAGKFAPDPALGTCRDDVSILYVYIQYLSVYLPVCLSVLRESMDSLVEVCNWQWHIYVRVFAYMKVFMYLLRIYSYTYIHLCIYIHIHTQGFSRCACLIIPIRCFSIYLDVCICMYKWSNPTAYTPHAHLLRFHTSSAQFVQVQSTVSWCNAGK
jgi:hypothetical protein